MKVPEGVKQPVALLFNRLDDSRMAMANRRDAKSRRQVHVPIAIGVYHVHPQGLCPYDGVIKRSALFNAAGLPTSHRRALRDREPIHVGGTDRAR
jgi:hypothetical protein